jgi:hypothetical protein
MGAQRWKDIWDRRALDRGAPSRLAALMAADGLDTGFGDVTEAAWRDFVGHMADRLGLCDDASAYEVGCGAGAFLLPLDGARRARGRARRVGGAARVRASRCRRGRASTTTTPRRCASTRVAT